MAAGAVTAYDGPLEDGRVQLLTNLPSDAVLADGKTKKLKVR